MFILSKTAFLRSIKKSSRPTGSIVWGSASHFTLSNGNRTATYDNTAAFNIVASSTTKSSGKWYVEVTATTVETGDNEIGFYTTAPSAGDYVGGASTSWGWFYGGGFYNNGIVTNFPTAFANGDTLMLAVDVGTGKMWWGNNGTWVLSGDPSSGANPVYTGTSGVAYTIAVSAKGGSSIAYALASTLTYTLPTGFNAW